MVKSRSPLFLLLTVIVLLSAARASADYTWQKQQAEVLPGGDLKWKPEPVTFEAGDTVRYIDYENGSDDNPGTREAPWKHHPWDSGAAGRAKRHSGPTTYVFRRGVTYRGALEVKESGEPGSPIRFTSDPTWGEGEARWYGSERVEDWKRLTAEQAPQGMPEPTEVYYADLDFPTRAVFALRVGEATRLKLARTPNWEVSDPYAVRSEWWKWQNPQWWERDYTTKVDGTKLHLGIDKQHLTRDADYYEGALVWSEWGVMMGAPYATEVKKFFPEKNAIAFAGPWGRDSQQIMGNCRYYLEDKPHYLDEAGEYWFEKNGRGGRLYVRLPGDARPQDVTVEAARHINFIDAGSVSHLHVSGLSFAFGNVFWRLDYRSFQHPDVPGAVVRVLGSGDDIRVTNNKFAHVVKAVRIAPAEAGDVLGHVVVTDNDVAHTDHGGIHVRASSRNNNRLRHAEVMRNRLREIGARPLRPNGHFAMVVKYVDRAEVAGNILDRVYAAGIDMGGGKGSGAQGEAPFVRYLVFNNKVTNSMLGANDWGGIETWQGGPFYVFNNISGNALGPMYWSGKTFSHAYYLDGSFKNYHFNNIAWGRVADPERPRESNVSAFQEIHSYQNTFFNNTAYNFLKGSRRQKPEPGRNKYLGNVFQKIEENVFRHSDVGGKDPNVHHAGEQEETFAYETNAYSSNVMYNVGDIIATFEAEGGDWRDLGLLAEAMERRRAMAFDVGVMADASPLQNPAEHNFAPAPGSAAIDRGVKAFVPWSLYATVAEWNFTRNNLDPTHIVDQHWYLTEYHRSRTDYEDRPMYPLTGVNIDAASYVDGPLEDWAPGAVRLDGGSQYLVLGESEMNRPFAYQVNRRGGPPQKVLARGAELKNPEIYDSDLLLEAYFRIEDGNGGVVIRKMDASAGYALTVTDDGRVIFAVKGDNGAGEVTGSATVADGEWHHVIAELDREDAGLRLYVDGKEDATAAGVGPDVSLANTSDLYVGGTPDGGGLAGAIDFARIAQGTLADSHTTIEELYAWQFDGPFLKDFTGAEPNGRRDAGALELR